MMNYSPPSAPLKREGGEQSNTAVAIPSCRIPSLSKTSTCIVFLVSWLLTYLIQDRFDASIFWQNGGGAFSDMATKAADGSLLRKTEGVALGCIAIFLIAKLGRDRFRVKGKLGFVWISLMLCTVCSCTWSDDPSLTIRRCGFFLLCTLFAIACALMPIENITLFLVGFGGIRLAVGIFAELALGAFHPFQPDYRFAGTVHPNLQAASLAVGIIAIVWSLWQRCLFGLRYRKSIICAGMFFFAFLLATGSRTSLIALLISVSVTASLVIFRRQPRQGAAVLALAAILVAAGIWSNSLDTVISQDTKSALKRDRDEGDPSQLTGRLDLWKECLAYSAKRPWLGYGFNSFWDANHIEDISSDLEWSINQSHSSYIQMLLDLGIVGASLYVTLLIGLLFVSMRCCWNGSEYHTFATAVITFVIVHNCLESINVLPTFPNFVFTVIMSQITLVGFRSHRRTSLPVRTQQSRSLHVAHI